MKCYKITLHTELSCSRLKYCENTVIVCMHSFRFIGITLYYNNNCLIHLLIKFYSLLARGSKSCFNVDSVFLSSERFFVTSLASVNDVFSRSALHVIL